MSTNDDLSGLHDLLVKQVNTLSTELGEATDPDAGQAILTEMKEFTHRIDIIQNLLATEETADITSAVKAVDDGTAQISQSLAQIDDLSKFVKDCTAFLTLVDKVIDTAKLAAIA